MIRSAHVMCEQGVKSGGKTTQHAFDGGPGQVCGCRCAGTETVDRACGERPVRGPFALKVGDDDEAVGALGGLEGEGGQLVLIDAE